jgi:GNAT superfamily N-acetyltransferase
MDYRVAAQEDLPRIMDVIRQTQAAFKAAGIDQWQNGYPSDEVILDDILNIRTRVVTHRERVIATVSTSFNNEPTYREVYNGRWLTDDAYMVAHRLAVDPLYRQYGIAGHIFDQEEARAVHSGVFSFKVDTHMDNLPMRRFLEKRRFRLCGFVIIRDGSKRLAYEKLLRR